MEFTIKSTLINALAMGMTAFACGPLLAQNAGTTDEVYLHCVAPNDPTSANDIHINKKSKTLTSDFGTAQKYAESGQFLIAEVFSDPDAGGRKTLLSTTKINTFNLEVLRMNHALSTASVMKCEKVEKKI